MSEEFNHLVIGTAKHFFFFLREISKRILNGSAHSLEIPTLSQ